MAELEINNAGNGIGAIDTGSAVFQDLNAVNRRLRNRIEIDKSHRAVIRSERIRSNAKTIDQDKGAAGIKASQRNRRGAGGEARAVVRRRDAVRTSYS